MYKSSETINEECITPHYENLPMQLTEIFLALKFDNFQLKKNDIFSYFCSKHRLWVHVRTASPYLYLTPALLSIPFPAHLNTACQCTQVRLILCSLINV